MTIRPTIAEEFHSSEVKSLRRFIYDNFGGAPSNPPILVQRDDLARRPYWRILSSAAIMLRREATGWDNGLRQYVVGYFDTDYDEVMHKLSILRSRVTRHASIPYRVYDARWFAPVVVDLADDLGTFPAGSYTISCSALVAQPGGTFAETLASDPVTITLDLDTTIEVRVPAWPINGRIASKFRVYVGPGTNARTLLREVDAALQGMTVITIDDLNGPAAPEPASSEVTVGTMSVDQISISAFESPEKDGEFDGIATIYLARALQIPDLVDWGVYSADEVTVTPPGSP